MAYVRFLVKHSSGCAFTTVANLLLTCCLFAELFLQVHKIIEQRDSVMRAQVDALTNIQRVQNGFLRSVRKTSSKTEATLTRELQSIVGDTDVIKKSLTNLSGVRSRDFYRFVI